MNYLFSALTAVNLTDAFCSPAALLTPTSSLGGRRAARSIGAGGSGKQVTLNTSMQSSVNLLPSNPTADASSTEPFGGMHLAYEVKKLMPATKTTNTVTKTSATLTNSGISTIGGLTDPKSNFGTQ